MESVKPASEGNERARVEETLEQIKAAVRQRQAELATCAPAGEEAELRVADLRAREYVQEPLCVSPRPIFGSLIVLARKLAYHLFFKWHVRGTLAQQNGFNQAASRLVQDLVSAQRELHSEVQRLRQRVAALEPHDSRRSDGSDSSDSSAEQPPR